MSETNSLSEADVPTGDELADLMDQDKAREGGTIAEVHDSAFVSPETGGKATQRAGFVQTHQSLGGKVGGAEGQKLTAMADLGWIDSAGNVTAEGVAGGITAEEVESLMGPTAAGAERPAAETTDDLKVEEAAPIGETVVDIMANADADEVVDYLDTLIDAPLEPLGEAGPTWTALEKAAGAEGTAHALELGVAKENLDHCSTWVRSQPGFADAARAIAMDGEWGRMNDLITGFVTALDKHREAS